VADVDDQHDQNSKLGQVVLPFLGIFAEKHAHEQLWWRIESRNMDKSEHLEPVEFDALFQEEQVGNGTNGVKPEVEAHVVDRN
jgi:hypothetical protein